MGDSTVLPQPGDVIAGRYLIERVIGVGVTSVVFGARHRPDGKKLFIKWLLPDDDEAQQETDGDLESESIDGDSEVVGHFQHPNVLAARDVGRAAGSSFLLMDWIEGESLGARLSRVGSLTLEEACRLLIPCLRGMHEAHAIGIVHGSLKPACILISAAAPDEPELAQVLDFEVNTRCSTSGDALALLSSPPPDAYHYQSPEQRAGESIDHLTDVYAFGAILYRTITGYAPFVDPSVLGAVLVEDGSQPSAAGRARSLAQRQAGERYPFRNTPRLLPRAEAIIARAMAEAPEERFESLDEFADALDACLCTSRPSVSAQPTQFVIPPAPRHAPPPWPQAPASQARASLPLSQSTPEAPALSRSGSAWHSQGRQSKPMHVYVAASAAVLVAFGLLYLYSESVSDTDVIASFEAVAIPGVPLLQPRVEDVAPATPSTPTTPLVPAEAPRLLPHSTVPYAMPGILPPAPRSEIASNAPPRAEPPAIPDAYPGPVVRFRNSRQRAESPAPSTGRSSEKNVTRSPREKTRPAGAAPAPANEDPIQMPLL